MAAATQWSGAGERSHDERARSAETSAEREDLIFFFGSGGMGARARALSKVESFSSCTCDVGGTIFFYFLSNSYLIRDQITFPDYIMIINNNDKMAYWKVIEKFPLYICVKWVYYPCD